MKLNAKEYKRDGWIAIYSKVMSKKFYLVRNLHVTVPDASLLRVTERGLHTLKGLKTHEIKELFQAAEIICSNVYDATLETARKQRKQKRVDRSGESVRKGVRQASQKAWC
mgnify:CR=1 FL=1|tara:strand:+ start:86 stop:418 length:333 start_codon:yes stop_codon:yes gene_type:complete